LVDRDSTLYKAGMVAGTVEAVALGAVNPCGLGARVPLYAVNPLENMKKRS
jgi:hypothetical protein